MIYSRQEPDCVLYLNTKQAKIIRDLIKNDIGKISENEKEDREELFRRISELIVKKDLK